MWGLRGFFINVHTNQPEATLNQKSRSYEDGVTRGELFPGEVSLLDKGVPQIGEVTGFPGSLTSFDSDNLVVSG